MKHVNIKTTSKQRYLVVYQGKIYASLRHFATEFSIPVGTITKLVTRKMKEIDCLVVSINGLSVEIKRL